MSYPKKMGNTPNTLEKNANDALFLNQNPMKIEIFGINDELNNTIKDNAISKGLSALDQLDQKILNKNHKPTQIVSEINAKSPTHPARVNPNNSNPKKSIFQGVKSALSKLKFQPKESVTQLNSEERNWLARKENQNAALYSIKTLKGYSVRSLAEKVIDDCLFQNGIEFYYEDRIIKSDNPTDWEQFIHSKISNVSGKERNYKYDWVVVSRDPTTNQVKDVYFIEYFGRKDRKYIMIAEQKRGLYNKLNLNMIALYPNDLKNIEGVLHKHFHDAWPSIVENKVPQRNETILYDTTKEMIKHASATYLDFLVNQIRIEKSMRSGTAPISIKTIGSFKADVSYNTTSKGGKTFQSRRDPELKIVLFDPDTEGGKFRYIPIDAKHTILNNAGGIHTEFNANLYDKTIIAVRSNAKLQKEQDYTNSYDYFQVDLTQVSESNGNIPYLRKIPLGKMAYGMAKRELDLIKMYKENKDFKDLL